MKQKQIFRNLCILSKLITFLVELYIGMTTYLIRNNRDKSLISSYTSLIIPAFKSGIT